jgi:hypothetical protein
MAVGTTALFGNSTGSNNVAIGLIHYKTIIEMETWVGTSALLINSTGSQVM